VDLPFRIEGPITATYGRPEHAGEWLLAVYFDSQAEASGFAAWVQSDHPSTNVGGAPFVSWHESDGLLPDTDQLPPQVALRVVHVNARTDHTGRAFVTITYEALGPYVSPEEPGLETG
jgi:hypothetical protein